MQDSINNKSKQVASKLPCPLCPSSDAFAIYDDDHGYCYSCTGYVRDVKKVVDKNEIHGIINYRLARGVTANTMTKDNNNKEDDNLVYTYEYRGYKGITAKTMEAYGCLTKINDKDESVAIEYPYTDEGSKIRVLPKNIYCEGNMSNAGVFGKQLFNQGSSRSITITEGENDAMAVYQMLGSKYPAVSVRSATQAVTDCRLDYEYINSFEKIYFCFDNDKVGQEALSKCVTMFDPTKVYIVDKTKYKDAHDYLQNDCVKEYVSMWWNAKKYTPKNIISDYSQIMKELDSQDKEVIGSYPLETLQAMTHGIRSGELVLITAQEKIGKTEILRCFEHHLLTTTKLPMSLIHLEEGVKRTIQGIATYELKRPTHLPDSGVSNKDVMDAYKKVTGGDENRCFFYNHFGTEDQDKIVDTLRYMVTSCGCKFVFLDHITMLATGLENTDERRMLDNLSTRLATLTRELDFTLFIVSHLNDDGKTRGSRNISKICDLHIRMERNKLTDNMVEQNTTNVTIIDNRYTGLTGPCGKLFFDRETYTMSELNEAEAPF